MSRYDLDTIAALAEGRLDPERARELERGIAADPVASAELAAHRTALTAAGTAPSPTLSTDERTMLRFVGVG
jgi:anti-sigma factor RsiW